MARDWTPFLVAGGAGLLLFLWWQSQSQGQGQAGEAPVDTTWLDYFQDLGRKQGISETLARLSAAQAAEADAAAGKSPLAGVQQVLGGAGTILGAAKTVSGAVSSLAGSGSSGAGSLASGGGGAAAAIPGVVEVFSVPTTAGGVEIMGGGVAEIGGAALGEAGGETAGAAAGLAGGAGAALAFALPAAAIIAAGVTATIVGENVAQNKVDNAAKAFEADAGLRGWYLDWLKVDAGSLPAYLARPIPTWAAGRTDYNWEKGWYAYGDTGRMTAEEVYFTTLYRQKQEALTAQVLSTGRTSGVLTAGPAYDVLTFAGDMGR
jgi:hypothetical protein